MNMITIAIIFVSVLTISSMVVGFSFFSTDIKLIGNASIVNTDEFVTFNNYDKKTLKLSNYQGTSTTVTIPSKIGDKEIAIIEKEAFKSKNLTSVIMPNTITSINLRAFQNNNLTEVIIPAKVSNIAGEAFSTNNLITVSFKMENPPVTIGSNIFKDNFHLTNICIPSTADETKWQTALSKMGVASTINIIKGRKGACSLIGTGELEEETILKCGPNSYQEGNTCVCIADHIGDATSKEGCYLNPELTCFTTTWQTWSSYLLINNYTCESKNITIPNSIDGKKVGKINKQAFDGKGITSVNLGTSIENIDMYSFRNNNLTEVTIPESVKNIVLNAFANNKLTRVIFKQMTPPTLGKTIFTQNPNLKTICLPDGANEKTWTKKLKQAGLPTDVGYYHMSDVNCQ